MLACIYKQSECEQFIKIMSFIITLTTLLVIRFREQLMFPFHFLDRLGKHDVTCTVSGGGRSAQAGAIRLAMARALCSFVTEEEVEWMRQGMS